MTENTQINTDVIDDEQGLRKAERIKGTVSILLWLAIFLGGSIVLAILFQGIGVNEGVGQIIVGIVPVIIALIVLVIRYFKTLKNDIRRLTKKNIIFTIVVLLVCLSIVIVGTALGISSDNQEAVEEELLSSTILMTISAIISSVICAPIVEELVFRKALSQVVNNKIIFIILSALSFGFIHMLSGFSFTVIAYIVMGAIFAITYIKTDKNIMSTIAVHFINNLVVVILALLGF